MALEPTKHVNGRMWQPGQSGNPNGRPVGSRQAFSAGFFRDLAEVWSNEGREAMVKTAKTNPTCQLLNSPCRERKARRRFGLVARDVAAAKISAVHALKENLVSAVVDNGDIHLPVHLFGLGFATRSHFLREIE